MKYFFKNDDHGIDEVSRSDVREYVSNPNYKITLTAMPDDGMVFEIERVERPKYSFGGQMVRRMIAAAEVGRSLE